MLLLGICEAVAKSFYGARGNVYRIWEVFGIFTESNGAMNPPERAS